MRSHSGQNGLHIAIYNSNMELALYLVEAGINLNLKTLDGETALSIFFEQNPSTHYGMPRIFDEDIRTVDEQSILKVLIRGGIDLSQVSQDKLKSYDILEELEEISEERDMMQNAVKKMRGLKFSDRTVRLIIDFCLTIPQIM